MEIEEEVCSSELAKELKELGVEQNSIFYWVRDRPMQGWESDRYILELVGITSYQREYGYSAFTVAELGEMLPEGYYSQKERGSWVCTDADNHLAVTNIYDCDNIYTEADARAKMLIYLIENNLIEK